MKTQRSGILAAGHFIVDQVKMIDAWPAEETLAFVSSTTFSNGGGAFNLLVDLAQLKTGLPLTAAGRIGHDAQGEWIINLCKQHKIAHTHLHQDSTHSTASTDVMTSSLTGKRTFFYNPGANDYLSENDVPLTSSNAKIFYLGYLGMLDKLDAILENGNNASARLLTAAQQAGMLTVADLVSAPGSELGAALSPCLPNLDVLFMNGLEAKNLCSLLGSSASLSYPQCAELLLSKGVKCVVIHEPEWALCSNLLLGHITLGSLVLPAELIVGSNGAGDAFAAGFLYAYHDSWPLEKCLTLASAVAAASLQSPTPSDSIPSWQECLLLTEKYPTHTKPIFSP